MQCTDSCQEWKKYINNDEELKRSWKYLLESTNDKNKHKIYTILGGEILEGYKNFQQEQMGLDADEEDLQQEQMRLNADEEELKLRIECLEYERTYLEYMISQEIADLKETLEEKMNFLKEKEAELKGKSEKLNEEYTELKNQKDLLKTRKNNLKTKEHEMETQMKKAIEEYVFNLFYNTITQNNKEIDFSYHTFKTPSRNGIVKFSILRDSNAFNIAETIKKIKGLTISSKDFKEHFKKIGDAIKKFVDNQKPPPNRQEWY